VVDNEDEKELGDKDEVDLRLRDALLVDGLVGVAGGPVVASEGEPVVVVTGFLHALQDSE